MHYPSIVKLLGEICIEIMRISLISFKLVFVLQISLNDRIFSTFCSYLSNALLISYIGRGIVFLRGVTHSIVTEESIIHNILYDIKEDVLKVLSHHLN